ncbi:MAG: hypothetical protein IJ833_05415 [Lachnospiraceae bacterium]|nr:hypothetical protein [Lachnospiraceae bacterium]
MDKNIESKTIEDSIAAFYQYNHINSERYTDSWEEHFSSGKEMDAKICKANLERRADAWLNSFAEEDKAIFLAMLEKFQYISEENFVHRIYDLSTSIYERFSSYTEEEILIVFVESSKGHKSGASEMIHVWWKVCQGRVRKDVLLEVYSKADEVEVYHKKIIVFVDDIVATGVTLAHTIRAFFERFEYTKFQGTKFYASGVVATKRGELLIGKLKKEGYDVEWLNEGERLQSAFRGDFVFPGDVVHEMEQRVRPYEEAVGKNKDDADYAMGYERGKLLIAFYYETPNNTLCTFWRYGANHVPLFERSSNQTITLEEIKRRKKKMADQAYEIKSWERKKIERV